MMRVKNSPPRDRYAFMVGDYKPQFVSGACLSLCFQCKHCCLSHSNTWLGS